LTLRTQRACGAGAERSHGVTWASHAPRLESRGVTTKLNESEGAPTEPAGATVVVAEVAVVVAEVAVLVVAVVAVLGVLVVAVLGVLVVVVAVALGGGEGSSSWCGVGQRAGGTAHEK